MRNERNIYLDILKGVCIILVIVGHSVQYGGGSTYLQSRIFFENPVFIFIYSFHMPLFMLISGYLFAYSVNRKKWSELLWGKFKQLIIPLGSWSIIFLLIEIFQIVIQESKVSITLLWIIKRLISNFIYGPWFLWAIWWCSFVVIIVRTFFKDNIYIYIIGTLFTFILPDVLNLQLYKFMWPFFLLAYIFNAYDYKTKIKMIYKNKIFVLSNFIIFSILLFLFNYDSYIYTSGYTVLNKNVLNQIYINFFRFFIGMSGSISIMYLIYFLEKILSTKIEKKLVYIGKNTLGIYIVSGILFTEVLANVPNTLTEVNYLYVTIESISVLAISIFINIILKRFKITNVLFLGGR